MFKRYWDMLLGKVANGDFLIKVVRKIDRKLKRQELSPCRTHEITISLYPQFVPFGRCQPWKTLTCTWGGAYLLGQFLAVDLSQLTKQNNTSFSL